MFEYWIKENRLTFKKCSYVSIGLNPAYKGVYFKGKECAPYGRRFFPFKADPDSERTLFAES